MNFTRVRRGRSSLAAGLAATLILAGLAAQARWHAPAAAAAQSAVVVPGGAGLAHRNPARTGALGVTFGFEDRTMAGGPYENQGSTIFNLPLYAAGTAGTDKFWLDAVEELVTSGVDFVAVDTRGFVPGSAVPNGGGDPRVLTQLVNAINQAGAGGKLKVAAFDDVPATLTDKKNQVKHHTGGYDPKFDLGDTSGAGEGGYQYLWDNDLKVYFQNVPDNLLYKVNGQPVVYLWSDDAFAFTNQGNGNSARLLQYVRSQAQAGFNQNPYFVVDQAWLRNDAAVNGVANGADGWFGVPGPAYTNVTFNGSVYGATAPSFSFVSGSTNMVIDPNHGQTLVNNLEATVNGGAALTLVEGFTDWLENAALFRTRTGPYSATQRDYPGQNLNILRRYSRTPFPTDFTVQAETADAFSDTTAGNQFGVYRTDDVDVQPTTDTGGGWNVGGTAAGEWLQWNEVPLQGTMNLRVRVAAPSAGAQVRFTVDGVAGPTVAVPNTGGWQTWQTVDAGAFQLNQGTYHTVQLQMVAGSANLNWWGATSATPSAVALRAHANNQYVTAGSAPLIADASSIGAAQQFDLLDQGNGLVAVRAHANNLFVCADDTGAAPLIANRASVGAWETYTLLHNADGSVSLRAQANNQIVTADNAGAAPLIANRTAIGPWEEFDLIPS
jgi:hypothetical protein